MGERFSVDPDARTSARCRRPCAAARLRSSVPREESDIGAAFLSESRTSLLGGIPSVAGDASWVVRLLLQKNATFNQEFRETIKPMRRRSSLDAREYYDYKEYEPLRHGFHWAPGMFYNFGGKLALSRSTWDAHQFLRACTMKMAGSRCSCSRRRSKSARTWTWRRSSGLPRFAIPTQANPWSTTRGPGRSGSTLPAHRHPSTGAGRPVCRRPRRQGAVMRGRARKQPVQCARFGFAGGFFI